VGGRLQGLKHKKLFYTIREMSLRSSPAVYWSGKIHSHFHKSPELWRTPVIQIRKFIFLLG